MSYIINADFAGQVGVNPRLVRVASTDSYATVIAAGYLSPNNPQVSQILPSDFVFVTYNFGTSSVASQLFIPSIASATGIITLNPYLASGNLSLPVVAGDIVSFNGTTGQIQDSGINTSSIQLLQITATLNQTAVQGAYAAPVQILPAVANKAYILRDAQVYTLVGSSAFATGGVAIVQYGNTVHGAGTDALGATIPAAEITAAASQIYTVAPLAATTVSTGITNTGIFFSNQTQAFTAGNGSSVAISLSYWLLTASV